MKRLFILLFSMLLIFTVGAYAQTLVPDPVAEYANVFTTFAALVAVIPVVVELVKKLVPAITYRSIVTQIVSWIVGIAVTFAGWYLQLGFLNGIPWQTALLYGIGASLSANGVADVGIVQWVIGLFAKKKTV